MKPSRRQPGTATSAGQPGPSRWHALWVTLVAGFMILLDVTIVAVALPSMQRDLGASPASVQWVVSGYALTFALALVLAGRLGDAIGRRRIFLGALATFVLCSIAAGAAPTITVLVIARMAQGIAAGCLAPQNSALIQQMSPEPSVLVPSACSAPSLVSPVRSVRSPEASSSPWPPDPRAGAGSSSSTFPSVPWHFCSAIGCCPASPRARRGHLDLPGVALLGCGVMAVMLPLVLADSGGVRRLWWLFPAGALLLVGLGGGSAESQPTAANRCCIRG
ncbi:MFS transporter [Streptomyces hirsutus]